VFSAGACLYVILCGQWLPDRKVLEDVEDSNAAAPGESTDLPKVSFGKDYYRFRGEKSKTV
jgi:hypothetical protein